MEGVTCWNCPCGRNIIEVFLQLVVRVRLLKELQEGFLFGDRGACVILLRPCHCALLAIILRRLQVIGLQIIYQLFVLVTEGLKHEGAALLQVRLGSLSSIDTHKNQERHHVSHDLVIGNRSSIFTFFLLLWPISIIRKLGHHHHSKASSGDLHIYDGLGFDVESERACIVLVLEAEKGKGVHELNTADPRQHMVLHQLMISHLMQGQVCFEALQEHS